MVQTGDTKRAQFINMVSGPLMLLLKLFASHFALEQCLGTQVPNFYLPIILFIALATSSLVIHRISTGKNIYSTLKQKYILLHIFPLSAKIHTLK